MEQAFNKINRVEGTLSIPGDKSISHRSVMFSSMAEGQSIIHNLGNGEDVKSTISCFSALGVEFEEKNNVIVVKGKGYKNLIKPDGPLYAGNSGTTTRLLAGILINQEFDSIITGDESLSQRPMKRIIDPLTLMGGIIESTPEGTLPLRILGSQTITPVDYELPLASAQVKSAILLAGLHLDGETRVIEKSLSRDHTERMLGLKITREEENKIIHVSKKDYPSANEYFVPGDISTAAFFIPLALLTKNSELRLTNVSLNESRTGIIKIFKMMGGNIETENINVNAGETSGDLVIKSSMLHNIEIPADIIPNIIDEIPVLAAVGVMADGKFSVRHAKELRGKESDRIKAVCFNLKLLGLDVTEFEDGFEFDGKTNNPNPVFESFNDHRIAMSFSILSLLLFTGGKVNNFDSVSISNPDFIEQLKIISR
jgi:3-phosphoshikimate 1-carboxyvinyltransferase